ncbi:hypothetical protein RhiirA4_480333 [Rhizophagus irregularis]|uniref:Uncharacterized protein n=1 Tax=Rhizophagus irregularis TaxID=588596 RepID=A0A2I1HHU4_9GLOM|nr:hypothetical protein RhiirA4_480333 [Rhizophagus irregularis]
MFYFTGEGLPLFPKVSSQQLHEIFVKNPSSAGQCPCLEQLRSSCWSFGQEQITLQIDISENSVQLEIFRYSSSWHDCAIALLLTSTISSINQTISSWNIKDFLEGCELKDISDKISIYLKSLEAIANTEEGQKCKRAKELLARYRKLKAIEFGGVCGISKVLYHSSLKAQSQPDGIKIGGY